MELVQNFPTSKSPFHFQGIPKREPRAWDKTTKKPYRPSTRYRLIDPTLKWSPTLAAHGPLWFKLSFHDCISSTSYNASCFWIFGGFALQSGDVLHFPYHGRFCSPSCHRSDRVHLLSDSSSFHLWTGPAHMAPHRERSISIHISAACKSLALFQIFSVCQGRSRSPDIIKDRTQRLRIGQKIRRVKP